MALSGDKLRQARKAAGLTQEQLAVRVGTSRKVVSTWENGHRQIHLQRLQHVAAVLNVRVDVLLDSEGVPGA